jgi:hypothetical protein
VDDGDNNDPETGDVDEERFHSTIQWSHIHDHSLLFQRHVDYFVVFEPTKRLSVMVSVDRHDESHSMMWTRIVFDGNWFDSDPIVFDITIEDHNG